MIGVKALLLAGSAQAHVSEGGIVLLLPTGAYSTAGVAVVMLTVLILFALPEGFGTRAGRVRRFAPPSVPVLRHLVSLIALAALLGMLWIGLRGPRDPLSNLMPLGFWTLGWVALVSLSGVFGNIWRWGNPWTGLYALIDTPKPLLSLPERGLGQWPAVALLIGFSAFLLADIAPDDPARLARLLAIYAAVTLAGLIICGPAWLRQVELGSAIFAAYGTLAPVSASNGGVGLPGWQILRATPSISTGVFAITLLAAGSFDGLNETFWWLGLIGVNPLEFPGRSAVVVQTVAGLLISILALIMVFAATIWAGMRLIRSEGSFATAFSLFALSLLPIALVYHIAHYFTSFLVAIQYTTAALSDPLARGDDWLGIEPFRVTTGFFNQIASVRLIWLTQAGLVVLGHVWSVVLAHRIGVRLFGDDRRAAWATLPLSLFMIAYTFLGLWLLAAPKGA